MKCMWIWDDMNWKHSGWDKTATILQTLFSNAFSWTKMYECCLRLHQSLFINFELTIFQHCSDIGLAPIICASLSLNELILSTLYLNWSALIWQKPICSQHLISEAGISLGMGLTNERWCYIVMMSLIGWTHTQNDPCEVCRISCELICEVPCGFSRFWQPFLMGSSVQ